MCIEMVMSVSRNTAKHTLNAILAAVGANDLLHAAFLHFLLVDELEGVHAAEDVAKVGQCLATRIELSMENFLFFNGQCFLARKRENNTNELNDLNQLTGLVCNTT